jgi:large subunit ribosomal protein L21
MYAIIETGGKQYRVAPGERVRVEKLEGNVGDDVEIERVLLVGSEDKVTVGTPTVSGAKVSSRIVAQGRAAKLVVYKLRHRKNYRRKQGHRQYYTDLEVTSITG